MGFWLRAPKRISNNVSNGKQWINSSFFWFFFFFLLLLLKQMKKNMQIAISWFGWKAFNGQPIPILNYPYQIVFFIKLQHFSRDKIKTWKKKNSTKENNFLPDLITSFGHWTCQYFPHTLHAFRDGHWFGHDQSLHLSIQFPYDCDQTL